jgi:hypothetical protein
MTDDVKVYQNNCTVSSNFDRCQSNFKKIEFDSSGENGWNLISSVQVSIKAHNNV